MRISRSNRWRRSGGKREEARGERKNGRRASREGGGEETFLGKLYMML